MGWHLIINDFSYEKEMFYHVLFLRKKKKKKKSLILSIFLSRLSQRNKPRRNPAFNLTAEFAVSCVPMCRVKREASGDFFFFLESIS